LLFATERRSQVEQVEILRAFLDCLTGEFTSVEVQALGASEQVDANPSPFFELHEHFFEIWRGTLDDAQAEAEEGAGTSVLSALSGALATIWRPALYDEWETKGTSLPVWGQEAEILQPLLLNISRESSPAARAVELNAFAACVLGLYQGGDSQEQILKNLSEHDLES